MASQNKQNWLLKDSQIASSALIADIYYPAKEGKEKKKDSLPPVCI